MSMSICIYMAFKLLTIHILCVRDNSLIQHNTNRYLCMYIIDIYGW